jgi:hypothetical protein
VNVKVLAAVLALATVMMAMLPRAADAAPYWPWCSRYSPLAMYTCAFASFEQCMDTVRGIGGYCYANPYPNSYTAAPGRPAKSRRHAASN